jgi:peroxiredoxin
MIDPNRSEERLRSTTNSKGAGTAPVVSSLQSRRRRSAILGPGERAPDFALHATPDQILALEELRGRPVILAFYPADWSPVCGDQMALYNEVLPEFRKLGAQLLGVSVDGVWCHAAFAADRKLRFPLLADFEPKGAVARAYGAYREQDGTSERALFVIDGDGVIQWSYSSPLGVNPGAEGILEALEAMQKDRTAEVP